MSVHELNETETASRLFSLFLEDVKQRNGVRGSHECYYDSAIDFHLMGCYGISFIKKQLQSNNVNVKTLCLFALSRRASSFVVYITKIIYLLLQLRRKI